MIKYIKNNLKKIKFNFLNIADLTKTPNNKWEFLALVLSVDLILGFIMNIMVGYVLLGFGYNETGWSDSLGDRIYDINSFAVIIFSSCVLTPVWEELLSRLLLSGRKVIKNVGIVLFLFNLVFFVGLSIYISSLSSVSILYSAIIIFTLLYCILRKISFISQYFVIFISVSFGLFHLENYPTLLSDNPILKMIMMPLILLPIILGGYLLGIVRIKLGLVWAMVMHGIFNFVMILFSLALVKSPAESVIVYIILLCFCGVYIWSYYKKLSI